LISLYLLSLGNLYLKTGDYAKSEPLLQRALAVMEKTKEMGPEYRVLSRVLTPLAKLYSQKGDYARAEPLLRRSLAISEKYLAEGNPEIISTLDRLAWLLRDGG
jgi:tetratricopeptide (TPR) repeat protein